MAVQAFCEVLLYFILNHLKLTSLTTPTSLSGLSFFNSLHGNYPSGLSHNPFFHQLLSQSQENIPLPMFIPVIINSTVVPAVLRNPYYSSITPPAYIPLALNKTTDQPSVIAVPVYPPSNNVPLNPYQKSLNMIWEVKPPAADTNNYNSIRTFSYYPLRSPQIIQVPIFAPMFPTPYDFNYMFPNTKVPINETKPSNNYNPKLPPVMNIPVYGSMDNDHNPAIPTTINPIGKPPAVIEIPVYGVLPPVPPANQISSPATNYEISVNTSKPPMVVEVPVYGGISSPAINHGIPVNTPKPPTVVEVPVYGGISSPVTRNDVTTTAIPTSIPLTNYPSSKEPVLATQNSESYTVQTASPKPPPVMEIPVYAPVGAPEKTNPATLAPNMPSSVKTDEVTIENVYTLFPETPSVTAITKKSILNPYEQFSPQSTDFPDVSQYGRSNNE